jgi:hypothetical protein
MSPGPYNARVSFAPSVTLEDVVGRLAELEHFSLAIARENAWESAVALANSRTDLERRTVRKLLDVRAAVLARLILTANLSPTMMNACRRVEQGVWWEVLGA